MKVGRPKGVVKPASASEKGGEEAADDDEVSMISNLIDDSLIHRCAVFRSCDRQRC